MRQADFWPARAAFVAILLILAVGKTGEALASARQSPAWRKLSNWLFPVAFAISLTGAFTFATSLAGAIAGLFVGAFAIAFATGGGYAVSVAVAVPFACSLTGAFVSTFAGAVTFAGTFILSVTFAFAVASAVDFLDEHDRPVLARVFLTCTLLAALAAAALVLGWPVVREDYRSLFLFLAALPLLNGLFDFFSYALTLSLIRRGLRSSLPLLWGLADLALACLLFLALGAVLVVAVHGLNLLAGVPFVDLSALFAGIHVEPGAYVWLYLMLFSTVLPTALHGIASLIGLQGLCPRPVRRRLARSVEAAPKSPLHAIAASLALGLLWTVPVICLVGLGWIAWHYGKGIVLAGLEQYFHLLLWLAAIPIGAI